MSQLVLSVVVGADYLRTSCIPVDHREMQAKRWAGALLLTTLVACGGSKEPASPNTSSAGAGAGVATSDDAGRPVTCQKDWYMCGPFPDQTFPMSKCCTKNQECTEVEKTPTCR